MKKLQITINYPWGEDGPTDPEDLKETMHDWSGTEWSEKLVEADIKITNK